MKFHNTGRFALGILGFSALAACGPSDEVKRQLAELQTVSAEKDSLIVQVAENSRLMSEIGVELAKAQSPAGNAGTQEVSGPADPDAIMAQIQGLTTRLNDSETRLVESQKRIQALSRESRGNESKLAEVQKAITDFQTTIDNQRQTILSLTEQVEFLQQENVQLVATNTTLTETVDSMADRENRVYYIVGTKQELLEKGFITEEGGSRVLFVFGRRGKTLVPGREYDPTLLTEIDLRETTSISLPSPEAQYEIVSAQDVTALMVPPDDKGRITGQIDIADPGRFWAHSKVLIIVQS